MTRPNFDSSGIILSRLLTIAGYSMTMSFERNTKHIVTLLQTLFLFVFAVFALGFAQTAQAQTVTRYTNTTDSATNGISDTATPCTNPFTRTFSVGTSYTVSNVKIGVLMAHTYRGDILMYLVSPTGTRIQLAQGDGAGADHINVLFDDSAASSITGHTANDTATAATVVGAGAYPYSYQNTFSPVAPLTGFNGQNAAGTWTLEICDRYAQDSGTFYQADLYLTSAPTNYADLSLTKTISNAAPTFGSTVTYTLTARNASGSPLTATGIVVTDVLPAGVTFVSSSGAGTYNSGTGAWAVGTLAPGGTATRTIVATVNSTSGATITNTAEITASSVPDIDSTPNNGVTSEDDYAAVSFTVAGTRTAGTPPAFNCPNGSVLFDWNGKTWTPGSTNNSYALGALGNINFSLINPGTWLNNAALGGQSPNNQNIVHGGFGTGEYSLIEFVDLASQSDVVTTTITLPRPMAGARFTLFDVDYGAAQFADKIVVRGELEGATVLPTLTNGLANYVIGNTAYGDIPANNDVADGNVIITFGSAIDKIVIEYGNHSLAPANPGQQAFSLHDITFCNLVTTLSVTKISSLISDPANGTTNPKAIPGALVEYLFSVSNPNPVSAQAVILTDLQPADLIMCVASIGASGPVVFTDGSPASGLTYTYT
ncbi:MAG: proprotein convertase P-domain-containing protein, partial [Pontixanthobacter sp.]